MPPPQKTICDWCISIAHVALDEFEVSIASNVKSNRMKIVCYGLQLIALKFTLGRLLRTQLKEHDIYAILSN